MKRFAVFTAAVLILLTAAWLWRGRDTGEAAGEQVSLVSMLSGEPESGFARATEPFAIRFPDDFGPHPEYQTEWWYYTGNLESSNERGFGFQFTIFRQALTPDQIAVDGDVSNWRTNQVYFAHFTVSDLADERFYFSERFSRGAAGLAGAQATPYRVWLEDWQVAEQPDGTVRLTVDAGDYALDLTLTQTLPPILHGEGGLSAKSLEPGNASYYYSQVQQRAEGTVTIEGTTTAVQGKAWKDHEYSTSVLSEGAIGWDWLSLQFDDGSALMLFEIRRADGSIEPSSSGTFINSDGSTINLDRAMWTLTVDDRWRSPVTNADYPVAWQLAIPSLDLLLEGEAQMLNQELNLSSINYWEGAVRFSGSRNGQTAVAVGYMEMTGYAEAAAAVGE